MPQARATAATARPISGASSAPGRRSASAKTRRRMESLVARRGRLVRRNVFSQSTMSRQPGDRLSRNLSRRRPAENSSNDSPGPTGSPSGSDCAHGGGTGWPDRFRYLRPGSARLEPRGNGLPVGRTAGQVEPSEAVALPETGLVARCRFRHAPSRRRRRRLSPSPTSAGSWVDCSRAVQVALQESLPQGREQVAVDPAASRGTEPRPWSDGR